MEGYQNPYKQRQQQPMTMADAGGDRFPQWSAQETKEFLAIRGELDRRFMETKRNKLLWEAMASRMKDRGFSRSSDQCKCKWKNLVTRYKGCETMEGEATRLQFPFYNELHAIFSARMQRMLWAEAEGSTAAAATPSSSAAAAAPGRKRGHSLSSEEEVDAYEDEESDEDHTRVAVSTPSGSAKPATKRAKKGKGVGLGVRSLVEQIMRRQEAAEEKWREAWEAREDERRRRDDQWRSTMEALEKERLFMERTWREREEQRRLREEARADRRDALITALFNRLNAPPPPPQSSAQPPARTGPS